MNEQLIDMADFVDTPQASCDVKTVLRAETRSDLGPVFAVKRSYQSTKASCEV